MKRIALPLAALAISVAIPCSSALALANRVFLSARSGNDANACDNINTPCQTFAGTLPKLNPGGEAIVLDSGGYGPVTITQSVTIEAATGVTAFIHPSSGNAITVNAGTGSVTLRGLVLNGGPATGIRVISVGTLIVENCSIDGFAAGQGIGIGILLSDTPSYITVKNTSITKNFSGISIFNGNETTAASTVLISLDHVHLDHNGFTGLSNNPRGSGAVSRVTITNSTANNNVFGIATGNTADGLDHVTLEFCVVSNNSGDGVSTATTNAAATLRLSNCAITYNAGFGVRKSTSGTIFTRTNNTIRGNGTDISPAMTPFSAD
jgi:hypothetical protein